MERLQAWFSNECYLLVRGAVNGEASMPGYGPFVPCMLVPTSTQILVSKVLSNPEWRFLSKLSTRNRAANAVVRITEESLQRIEHLSILDVRAQGRCTPASVTTLTIVR